MTMPADVQYVQISGTWLDDTGAPCNANPTVGPISLVVISPRIAMRYSDYTSQVAVMPQRQVINLDATGSLPQGSQVIATDTVALAGIQGLTYQAAVILYDHAGQQISPYSFTFTAPAAGPALVLSAPQYAVTGNSVGMPAM